MNKLQSDFFFFFFLGELVHFLNSLFYTPHKIEVWLYHVLGHCVKKQNSTTAIKFSLKKRNKNSLLVDKRSSLYATKNI